MIKFKDYFKEEWKVITQYSDKKIFVHERYFSKILSMCSYYRKIHPEWASKPIFRGIKSRETIFQKPVRTNRRSLDTPPEVNKMLNNELKKRGLPLRSKSVFVTGDRWEAERFGNVYVIFPVGKFKFAWSPEIEDFFIFFNSHTSDIDYYIKTLKTTDFPSAVKSGHEIIIECKSYWAISVPDNT